MGSGKSTLGRRIAHRLKLDFVDLDNYLEKKHGCSVVDIFSRFGELQFREWEREALIDQLDSRTKIVSTGGGTPCYFDNMELINQNGFSIYLYLSPGALVKRLFHSKNQRPALIGLDEEGILNFVNTQIDIRKKFYEQANLQIDAINLNFDRLIELIQSAIHPESKNT